MKKRGQTQWEMTGWILAILVLVAIGVIVYYFMSASGDITDNMIQKAEVMAQTCGGLASEEFVQSYCLQLREIDSEHYVTCHSLTTTDLKYGVVIGGGDGMKTICSPEYDIQLYAIKKAKCNEINSDSKKEKTIVTGESCRTILAGTCEALGGEWSAGTTCAAGTAIDEKKIDQKDRDLHPNLACCKEEEKDNSAADQNAPPAAPAA